MKSTARQPAKPEPKQPLAGPLDDRNRLAAGEFAEPHRLLGAHPLTVDGVAGTVVRTWHPEATSVELLRAGSPPQPMEPVTPAGLFATFLPGVQPPLKYRLVLHFRDGQTWEREDPYRFLPTLGDLDLHLFNEGKHRRVWEHLGARERTMDGVAGTAFAVWAPSATRVSLVGDFCFWDGRVLPMRQMGSSGVFELFLPHIGSGTLYKFEIRTKKGELRSKTDPYAAYMEHPPGTAARIFTSRHKWADDEWMSARPHRDATREPILIYELHAGSWGRNEDGSPLGYRQLAERVVAHVKSMGFTHIEPLPLSEHPFGGSWGYQVSGYYAPTARYGDPDDFRAFVDYCHQHGIGVIVDWVPAHFPKDDFALRLFDGTALYEHEDPRRGEHPDWGTLIFNYGRNEVKNFLIGSALCWLKEYHVDGLRVDAVASMLYLDYSRKEGQWVPNRYGGREDLEAIDFIRELNETVRLEAPGALMVAEESTSWGGVTRSASEGGLGFTFKWNMGWMHDTLLYYSKEPIHRRFHHNELTFSMIYENTERFVMPLSHDEVVHGKGSLLSKMPGDLWQQFANLRLLLAYQYTRPGKKLLFMGTELAPWYEWNYEWPLDWSLERHPERAGLRHFLGDLGRLYRSTPALWRNDPDQDGYSWIDCHDCDNSVLSFARRDTGRWAFGRIDLNNPETLKKLLAANDPTARAAMLPLKDVQVDNRSYVVVILNNTPVPREPYRVGLPIGGKWTLRINSDAPCYGGSGYHVPGDFDAESRPWHSQSHSVELRLPPLGALILTPG